LEDPVDVPFAADLLRDSPFAEKLSAVREEASWTEGTSFPDLNSVALMLAVARPAVQEPAVVVVAVAGALADGVAAAETIAAVRVPAVLVPGSELVPIGCVGNAETALGPLQGCVLEPENAAPHVPEQAMNVLVLEKTAPFAVAIPVAGWLVAAAQQ
jgi:hypothetical protein